MKRFKLFIFLTALVIPTLIIPSPSIAHDYTMTEMGSLGGWFTTPYSINNYGVVVGKSAINPAQSTNRAFVWTKEYGISSIGALTSTAESVAFSINDQGQIVGQSYLEGMTPEGGNRYHAFLYMQTQGIKDIGSQPTNEYESSARGINNKGFVVGYTTNESTPTLWRPDGSVTLLSGVPAYGQAYAINNNNQVVGWADFADGRRGFLWSEQDGVTELPTSGYWSRAYDINDLGQVVGYNQLVGPERPFIWTKEGGMIDFLAPDQRGMAYGINNLGQVVGWYGSTTDSSWAHAFVWSLEDGLIDLGPLGTMYQSSRAYDINDLGQIVGSIDILGLTPQGTVEHAVIWNLPTPTPEPTTMLLLGLGLMGLAGIRRIIK